MKRRRPIIEPKKPVFFGCEGDSEVAYGQVINDLLRSSNLPVHLHVESLAPGAGDPLARVQRALQRIAEREKKRGKLQLKVILMDSDQTGAEPERATRANQLAAQHNIMIIWQDPCHEALLLRHMPGCSDRQPLTCHIAQQALKRFWPEYDKPMLRAQLAKRINLHTIRQVAGVVPELHAFLEDIGLLR